VTDTTPEETEAERAFQRQKTIFEQDCQEFRSLNGFLWQIPVIVSTLTGGLWEIRQRSAALEGAAVESNRNDSDSRNEIHGMTNQYSLRLAQKLINGWLKSCEPEQSLRDLCRTES
jgi:hypothetical protein